MSGISKRVSGSWVSSDYGIMKTATDTITTLPADIYPNDTTATVGLKGNMSQTGTPTPTTPIQPQETGERTGNLWDEDYTGINTNAIYRPLFVGDGEFTLSTNFKPNGGITDIFLLSGNVSSGISSSTNGAYEGKNITAQSVNGYITIAYRANARQSSGSLPYCKTMLNTGSTPLPYEPYGYKLDISSGDTTTPVYLGEVETTRKVKKWVLTGNETWYAYSAGNVHQFYTQNMVIGGVASSSAYSTIAPYGMTVDSRIGDYGCYLVSSGNEIAFQMYGSKADFPTQTEWKSYLAQQYAAGTPVCVWYVLANETTGIVNEPLRKIGDYADTVSGITIPVTAGGDTISVDTTLQPSEVTVNYKGWHPAIVHERTNGAWT